MWEDQKKHQTKRVGRADEKYRGDEEASNEDAAESRITPQRKQELANLAVEVVKKCDEMNNSERHLFHRLFELMLFSE